MLAREWARRVAHGTRYLAAVALMSLVWEAAHLPLYTLWVSAGAAAIVADVFVCTAANLLISLACYAGAHAFSGERVPPGKASGPTIAAACAVGVAYTAYSEWVNVHVLRKWAYSELRPVIPGIEIGVSPLLQWIVLPAVGLLVANRSASRGSSAGW